MTHHRGIHSQKFVEKRRKKRQTLVFLVALCAVTLAAAFILLLRAPFLQIKTVAVEGATFSSPQAVSNAALASLLPSYLNLVPYSNIFLYSKAAIRSTLLEKFKDIKDLSVHRNGFSALKVFVKERVPAAVVCAGFRADAGEGDCYFGDDKGYLFAAAATSSPVSDTLSHYYIPAETATTSIGNNFIPEKRFDDLQQFLKGSAKAGLLPLGVLIGDNGTYEMYIKNKKSDSEVTVYFDDRSSFEKTLGNLLTFWQGNDSARKTATTTDFDYINLRFGNTVYYSTQ
jgi:hypothetical protein